MNAHASPIAPPPETGSSLAQVLAALSAHDDKALAIQYGGQRVQPGYHVTEVKAGSFVTIDCGGNADAWGETILQVEDIPGGEGQTFMPVGKFRSILAQVDRKVRLDRDARLTFEIGPPGQAMQVFDVATVDFEDGAVVLRLAARPAICKPRHRMQMAEQACCSPSKSQSANCCA